jgi:starch phosphorylase
MSSNGYASDISEHISTAGTEASGTSNMKFALNGGLIIGTLDGANIEIREAIGKGNMFTFGLTANEIDSTRAAYQTRTRIEDPRLEEVVNYIRAGEFGDPSPYSDILDSLHPPKDYYLLGADFATYLDAHQRVDAAFRNRAQWARMSILSTAGMSRFSSDRSVTEYANNIWHVKPCKPPTEPSKHH